MKSTLSAASAALAFAALLSAPALSGQFRPQPALEPGVKYCPAPWGNNAEFLDTHFGVDARTGVVTKYSGTVHPDETGDIIQREEQVVYVAPPISVENRFVPNPNEPHLRPIQTEPAPRFRRGWSEPAPAAAPQPTRQLHTTQKRNQPQARVSGAPQPAPRISSAPPAQPRSGSRNGKQPWWRGIFRNGNS